MGAQTLQSSAKHYNLLFTSICSMHTSSYKCTCHGRLITYKTLDYSFINKMLRFTWVEQVALDRTKTKSNGSKLNIRNKELEEACGLRKCSFSWLQF